ncbi:hypothetical protein GCM10022254_52600 [Actinomadura meridiana]|uniref:DNA primase n=1 Tax=Actinomadura meridiana TaxID=559626 RepID=A0ABP8CDU7_9ACTN
MADDEQRHRRLDVLQGVADYAVDRLTTGGIGWDAWLVQASRHGRYGFTNTLLIPAQRRSATDVRSYETWQKAGRQVRHGETGIQILSTRGRPRRVFDIEQTDGEAVEAAAMPTAEGLQRLCQVAAHLGFYIDRGQGWTYAGPTGRRLQVAPELDDTAASSLLAHQLAHVLRPGGHLDTADSVLCHGVRRVLADSVAFLVLTELGSPVAHLSFPPVRHWAGTDVRTDSPAAVRAVGEQVIRISTRLRRQLQSPAVTAEAGQNPTAAPAQRSSPPPEARTRSTTHEVQHRPNESRSLLRAALADAHGFYRGHLSGSWAARYLADRGVSQEVQEQWEVGFAPRARHALLQRLRALGHSDETSIKAGLVKQNEGGETYDLLRDRVLFPLRDPDGQVIGFIGRRRDESQGPKYLNTPETDLFRKGEILFGLHEVRARLADQVRPLLVEGPLDAIAVNTAMPETYAAIAPCGTAITSTQVNAVAAHTDLETTGLVIALDGDPAGRAGAIRAWPVLHRITTRLEAALLPQGHDPAELLSPARQAAVHKALLSVTPLADLVIDERMQSSGGKLEFIESRLAAARAAAHLIAELPPDQIARQVARVATRTGMPPAEVTALVISTVSPEPDAPLSQPLTPNEQRTGTTRSSRTASPKPTNRRTA